MRLVYGILMYLFKISIRIASLFSTKALKWINGRKNQFTKLRGEISDKEKLIWFHCASLGEFEQGRPVIEAIRESFRDHKILLTFFSPSGYEVRKNTNIADYVHYLPLDTRTNAKKFLEITRPRIAFFIKYEFWFNYINELSNNKIPTLVVSTIFTPSQYLFKPWGLWFARQLQKITYFFVQDEKSLDLLNKIKVYHADIGGDTRFDRVLKIASEEQSFKEIEAFNDSRNVIVCGSTWPADEEVLLTLLKNAPDSYKMILAPHELGKERIEQLSKKFRNFKPVIHSRIKNSTIKDSRILIIDQVGFLSYLYRYAKIAYIGGGFGVGIHNVLEAATYGIPVIFGPNYTKFREAVQLEETRAGFPVKNANECIKRFKLLTNDDVLYNNSSDAARRYVRENAGATRLVIEKVKSYLITE